MDLKTPSTLTLTIRRNPHRRARPTPVSPLPPPSFPLQDIQIPPPKTPTSPTENLKVFLRIRPINVHSYSNGKDRNGPPSKNAWPKNTKLKNGVSKPKGVKNVRACITVNDDGNSITISPPLGRKDSKRMKTEVYQGFQSVFAYQATQVEVYEKLLKPLVDDFLKGKSGMLAAVGPSGSGKTHTMFGCVREPGMVPLALADIFSSYETNSEKEPRTLYMSMFEISSEKGKSERISDLLQGVPDPSRQHSTVKGVQQVIIQNAHQAEILLASGMLKRATAGTNTNSQSSRSQCIINFQQATREVDDQADYSELTIVDLAGAEREKRTGNQGTRLLESNFINNTSMVFGLCLRALLEHQKNPKRQLQKHFQSSMLTRYLRDYLEGKKRMSLILTVKPSEEDYLDTSFVLRQASPYMQIKFSNVEQPNNLTSKRSLQTLNRAEPVKKRKHTRHEVREIKYEKILGDPQIIDEGHATGSVEDANLHEILINSEDFSSKKRISMVKHLRTFTKAERNYKVLEGLSKAMWKILKEYNIKLKDSQQENRILNAELAKERKRCSDLESLIQDVKFKCRCGTEASESNIYGHENLLKEGTSSGRINYRANHEASDRQTKTCLRSCEALDKTTGSHCSGENENPSIDKLNSAVYDFGDSEDSTDLQAGISSEMSIIGTSSENVNYRSNHEANVNGTISCLQSCEGLDKTTESYGSQKNKNHFIQKLEAAANWIDEEAGISSVSDVLPLTNFNVSGDYMDSVNVTDVRGEYMHHNDENITSGNTTYLEINELGGLAAKSLLQRDEEADISSVSDVLPFANFNDSGDSLDSINVTDVRREYMHHNDENVTTGNTTDLEVNELGGLAAKTLLQRDEETSVLSVSDFLPLANLHDSGDSLDSINVTDVRREYMHHHDEHVTTGNTPDLEINDLGGLAAKTLLQRDEEPSVLSVSDFLPLVNFNDSGDSLDSTNVTDVRTEHVHPNNENLTTGNTTDLEINELADSVAPFSDSSRENVSLGKEEQHLTCSSNLESAVSSFQSRNSSTENTALVTKDKRHECAVPPLAATSTEVPPCNVKCENKIDSEATCISSQTKDSQNLSKPKRRLLPVSSLLLKDMSSLAIEDETDKRKGGRADKRAAFDEKIKTQSKTSLLQLLQRNVVR